MAKKKLEVRIQNQEESKLFLAPIYFLTGLSEDIKIIDKTNFFYKYKREVDLYYSNNLKGKSIEIKEPIQIEAYNLGRFLSSSLIPAGALIGISYYIFNS